MPREYGAYAELAFPLLTGLVSRRPTVAAVLFVIAAVAWFLVHEPFAVLRGTRGQRLQSSQGARAMVRVRVLVATGVLAGSLALAVGAADSRLAMLVPAAFALLLLPAVVQGKQKSLIAELVLAAALSSMLLPVGIASGVAWVFAWEATAVWFVSFALITFMVHGIKARHKRGVLSRWTATAAPGLALLTLAGSVTIVSTDWVPVLFGAALIPAALLVLVVNLLRVHPRQLKVVGWSVVGSNVVTLVLLVVAGRF